MDLINSYAIVAYVAGPIARFADRLRGDLVPGTGHHAHITILPPRPLCCPVSEAIEFARPLVGQFEPFEVRIGGIAVFEATQVIHLSVVKGFDELAALHQALNAGGLGQREAYQFTPHITLGHQFPDGSFEGSLETARRRWEEFGEAGPLRINALTFVQQRADLGWEDLAELELGRVGAGIEELRS